jgi:putative Ca2+/H+ antiporter (TMEM165/GDT1 family)
VPCDACTDPIEEPRLSLSIALAVFPIIFVGELPDKTMFASLLMATKGRPLQVWLGAAGAFVVHVVIAVTIGVALFRLLPLRAVDGVVAGVFLISAIYAWREGAKSEEALIKREIASSHRVVATAFLVIFVAEWGDLTQILTANLAAHYHDPLPVAIGAVLALWCVAAVAVIGGQSVLRLVNVRTVRKVTAVVLLGLCAFATWSALR